MNPGSSTDNSRELPLGDGSWNGPEERSIGDPELTVDLDGFEGPLDLLLELAKRQKVDLKRISILSLAEQYLAFIESVRRLRIEIAADYLVMAAWLAYLKSRLLLPEDTGGEDGPTGEEMRAMLEFRLQRLEAMRDAGRRLVNRNRLGRDFFARGMPEPIVIETTPQWSATLYDLLTAYASMRQRGAVSQVTIARRQVWSLADAREILVRLIGEFRDWSRLDEWLLHYLPEPAMRVTAIASTFAASLEMVREGKLELRQESTFAPIFLRQRKTVALAGTTVSDTGESS
jgi:segregation and condensation protein A